MTAATDLATAKTQADTTATATGTLITNCASAVTSEVAANTAGSKFARMALAAAYVADTYARKAVFYSNVDRGATNV